MSKMSEKVAYLKGLAEGLGVNGDTEQGKLMLAMIDVLDAFAEECKNLDDKVEELEEYVEDIDNDVSDLEEALFSEEDDDDALIEYECPHCGTVIFFDEEAFDMEQEHLCPNCNRKVFEEDEEPEDEE